MKKLRKALKNVNVDIEDPKRHRHPRTLQIVASDGRRVYKLAKKKAAKIRKDGKLPQI
jgi:uncharacterized protein